ncbi:MAG: ROK family protein, partial [Solirubrobacterales bacterium]|nr:ROK family protein [Solirubrobacterales bacterium]
NLLEVEAIVIGGGLGVRLGEPFVRRIRKAMMPHTFNDAHPPEVLLAGLGDLGGALGAALLVSRRLEGEPAPVAVASSGGGAASAGDAPVGDAGSGGDGAETASTPAAGDSAPAGEAPGAEDVPSAL